MSKQVKCRDCGRLAEEMSEYTSQAALEEVDVNDWVRMNDGLYDRATDTVVCTPCYAKGIARGVYR